MFIYDVDFFGLLHLQYKNKKQAKCREFFQTDTVKRFLTVHYSYF